MGIEVRIAENDELKNWDRLVEASPHGSIFHTWKWLKIIEKHTGSKLYPLIGLKGTTPIGIFPLFYQKKFLVKTVFSPPPQVAVPYLGPALVDYDKLKQDKKESIFIEFQKRVDEFIFSEIKPNYTLISSPLGLLDSRPFKWTGYLIEPMYNYLIDLSEGVDHVWYGFQKQLRIDTKKTERKGVHVEEGFKEELEILYESLSDRYEEQNRILPLPKKYLLNLYYSFHPQNLRIFVAKYQAEVVGGLIALCYKDKLSLWVGIPKTNLGGVYPNDLVQWEAIKWACEHDLKYYELMGGNTLRLCHYKSKYNPDLSIYFSARKYSSIMSKLAETAYIRLLKPMYAKIKLKNR